MFVLRQSINNKNNIYIWQGSLASNVVVEITINLCKQLIGSYICGDIIEIIKSGYESELSEFNNILIYFIFNKI